MWNKTKVDQEKIKNDILEDTNIRNTFDLTGSLTLCIFQFSRLQSSLFSHASYVTEYIIKIICFLSSKEDKRFRFKYHDPNIFPWIL